MTLETIANGKRYRIAAHDACLVEVQSRYRGRWQPYRELATAQEAIALILELARGVEQEQMALLLPKATYE